MGKIKMGGYIFLTWAGDHFPRHVHVYRDGKLILKYNLEKKTAMKGKASKKVLALLNKLEAQGEL